MTIVQEIIAAKPASEPRQVTKPNLPGQVVLVLQGGGALGAYQAGVYQGLHEAGIEPDWVIGTSAPLAPRSSPATRWRTGCPGCANFGTG
jgi:hypothetical protein